MTPDEGCPRRGAEARWGLAGHLRGLGGEGGPASCAAHADAAGGLRAQALAAAELSTYDEVKSRFLQFGVFTEGLALTVATAFVSGYVSTVASSPFDVVKSRVMGQKVPTDGSPPMYAGMADCFIKSAKSEGIMSLYNGFWPNFGRVVPRVTIVFIVMEQLKKNFG